MRGKKIVLASLMEALVLSCSSGDYSFNVKDISENSVVPINPNMPINPGNPSTPTNPTTPVNPGSPSVPVNPTVPGTPITPGNPSTPINPTNPGTPGTPTTPVPIYKLKDDPERFQISLTDNPDVFTVHTFGENVPESSGVHELENDIITASTDEKYIGVKVTAKKNPVTGKYEPSYEGTFLLRSDLRMKGKNSIGIYSKGVNVLQWQTTIEIQENSVGIYAVANDEYTDTPNAPNANTVISTIGDIEINGKNSIGMYYKSGNFQATGTIISQGEIRSSFPNVIGIFTDSGSDEKEFVNEGKIDLQGEKTVGMYGKGNGGYKLKNSGNIIVSPSSDRNNPNIGMYTKEENIQLVNDRAGRDKANIRVEKNSIGMMKSKGANSSYPPKVLNDSYGVIELAGDNAIGMVLGENVYGVNKGIIKTVATNGKNPEGVIGVIIGKNARFENGFGGIIEINSPGGTAILKAGGTLINNGIIRVSDGAVEEREIGTSDPEILSKRMNLYPFEGESTKIYVDTLGNTNPIEGIGSSGLEKINLVMGAEAASKSNETEIKVDKEILNRYNKSFKGGRVKEIEISSDALLWNTEYMTDGDEIKDITLKKKSYTEFAESEFERKIAAGLDSRYQANTLDSEEKQLFNNLNTLNNSQRQALSKTYKEISGSQYINVQQRLKETDDMIGAEIEDLRDEIQLDALGNNSKIRTFVTNGKYSAKTEEVPDHKTTGFGAAYINKNDKNNMEWYVAAGVNNFKLEDTGRTEEEISMLKAGVYKTFDLNNEVEWTVLGEGHIARSEMERKYEVLGVAYTGQASYNSYGMSMKNKVGKNFSLSDNLKIKPYAALETGYGKFQDIKEKNGVLRLEVEGNDYYSIKPELGLEISYAKPILKNSRINAGLKVAYDYELGKIENTENKARFRETSTDWFTLKGEKDESRGNVKADLKVGVTTGNYDFSIKAGYNSRGKDARIGVGIGASF